MTPHKALLDQLRSHWVIARDDESEIRPVLWVGLPRRSVERGSGLRGPVGLWQSAAIRILKT